MALFVLLAVFFVVIVAIALFAFPAHRIVEWMYKDKKKPEL
jgi:hypothetical protein